MSTLIKRSLVDQALDQLRARINSGAWAIGQRLPTEPELAAQLGISRNTVREAMRVLAFSGLIEIRQGDGSYLRLNVDPFDTLKALSGCSLEQARETRRIIEVQAIGLAAVRRTDEDLQALHEALNHSGEHYHGDVDRYIECDLVFHRRLVDAAHNPTLSELYRFFSGVMGSAILHALNHTPRNPSVFHSHGDLLAAVEARDPERAMSICQAILDCPDL